jgi:HPt (histidine-containing phosphotransfer) domain-containing protein
MYKGFNMISENYKQKVIKSITDKFGAMGISDEDTINELCSVSLESLEEEVKKVEDILESDDISELAFHTHTIKGILLNVGLDEDANRFKEIKHLVNKKSIEEIKEITKERISIFKG